MIATMYSQARSCIASALLGVGSILCARAQVVDFQKERQPVVEIHGLWRFHTGDDPDGKLGWANPAFDDSSWKLLRSDQPWSDQVYKGYGRFARYRFQLVLPANHPPLALCIPMLPTSYLVFAGGRLIGKMGGMPPHETVQGGTRNCDVIPIPADVEPRGMPLAIAIRVWHWPHWAYNPGGPTRAALIGDASLLNKWSIFRRWILLLGFLSVVSLTHSF